MSRLSTALPFSLFFLSCWFSAHAHGQQFSSELIFPLHPEHNHAPGLVETASGDLIASWYRGSGERRSDDVAVYGARLKAGETQWSDAFLMADREGFPDCNTCMMIDSQERLWLFWPTIVANTWESCFTNYRVASNYSEPGPPKWDREGIILLKPDDFAPRATTVLDEIVETYATRLTPALSDEIAVVRTRLSDKLYQRLGWQPRCKPTVLPSGRILLPLYTDTFSISIMAISDDEGATWYASQPLIGFGNIQPAVLRRGNGTLVAYMRENGPSGVVRVCESQDDGLTWGPVTGGPLPNPGSGLDAVRLSNGHWLMVYNDVASGRNSLAVSISQDEGVTWSTTRHLESTRNPESTRRPESQPSGSFHYPVVIQGKDDAIHVVYSYFVDGGKSMKHAKFDEAWVAAGD